MAMDRGNARQRIRQRIRQRLRDRGVSQQQIQQRLPGLVQKRLGQRDTSAQVEREPVTGPAPPRESRVEGRIYDRSLNRAVERRGGEESLNERQLERIRERSRARARKMAQKRLENPEGPGSQIDTGRDQSRVEDQERLQDIYTRGHQRALERRREKAGRELTERERENIRKNAMRRAYKRYRGGLGAGGGEGEGGEAGGGGGGAGAGGGGGGGDAGGGSGGDGGPPAVTPPGGGGGGGTGETSRGSAPPDKLATAIHNQLLENVQTGGYDPDLLFQQRLNLAEQQGGMFDRGVRELRGQLAARGLGRGGTLGYETRRLREGLDIQAGQSLRDFAIEHSRAAQDRVLRAIDSSTGRSLGMADIELRKMAESRLFGDMVFNNRLREAQFIEGVKQARQGNYLGLIQMLLGIQNSLAAGRAPA